METNECRDALRTVEDVVARMLEQQRRLDAAVEAARNTGATWGQIGEATGMTRQSAHERWGHLRRLGCPRQGCDCTDHQPLPEDCNCGHGPGRGRALRRALPAAARGPLH